MSLIPSLIDLSNADVQTSGPGADVRTQFHRVVLVLGILGTAAIGLTLTLSVVPPPAVEPNLVRLLRGKVLIKALIALGAAALAWWRFGRPVEGKLALRYTAALCVSAAALAWLWGLHLMLLGSLFFYAGLAGVVLTARHDPLLSLRAAGT